MTETRIHHVHDDAARDLARIRAELADRLDRCDDVDIDRALHWLAHEQPDAVAEALDETEAPL